MLSDVMEDYLKAVYVLEQQGGAPVSTSAIADYLDVTPPTVTSMVETLEERDLLDREKYQGVELTEEGEIVALEVIRHHRLLEAYLAEQLDYEWSEVHDEADALEHHISEEFEQRVAETLGEPTTDPHGDPIPDAELRIQEREANSLSETAAGVRVVVDRVSDRDDEELAYLSEIGIQPGVELDVLEHTPIGTVRVSGTDGEHTLPEAVAAAVLVRTLNMTQ